MRSEIVFQVDLGDDPAQALAAWADPFAVVEEGSQRETVQFLDSFDWRLFNRAMALTLTDGELALIPLRGQRRPLRQQVKGVPVFAWDLPDSRLKQRVQRVLEMRALLPRADVHAEVQVLRLLNEDQKTVVRLVLERIESVASEDAAPTFVSVLPLRGYEAEANQVIDRLIQVASAALTYADYYAGVMLAAGQLPGDYTAKPDVHLEPDMPAGEAARALLQADLDVIQINEGQIAGDIDTEFLHDYRVALRRSRSVLSLVGKVFPAEPSTRFRADLKEVNQHNQRPARSGCLPAV